MVWNVPWYNLTRVWYYYEGLKVDVNRTTSSSHWGGEGGITLIASATIVEGFLCMENQVVLDATIVYESDKGCVVGWRRWRSFKGKN